MEKVSTSPRTKHVSIALHVLIWGAMLIVPFFLITSDNQYGQIGPLRCNFFTLASVTHIGVFYLNAFYLYPKFLNRKQWGIYLICIVALLIGVYHLKSFILVTWFPALASHDGAFRFTFFPTIFFLVISTIYRRVVDRISYERKQSLKKSERLASELKFLRSQVSPHFLFNVLNNLVSMARHKSDQLEPSLIKLSGLMRYMLYESDVKKVSVATEIEYLKSYIELQKLRFEDDIKITTDIQYDEDYPYTIEPLLLIPFVENAFKHGVTFVHDPFINIALRVANNKIHFAVENKFGEASLSKDNNSGIGLANVKARLNLLYPGAYKLLVETRNDIFSVHLSLQLK